MKRFLAYAIFAGLWPVFLEAQIPNRPPHGQGYIFVGAGSRSMSPVAGFGGEGYFGKGFGLGAEMGAAGFSAASQNNALLGLVSLDFSYHHFPKKIVGSAAPFVAGGYTIFFGHNATLPVPQATAGKVLTTSGFNVGGGLDYFATRHIGVRLDLRYYGHGGTILHYTFPDVSQLSFVAARVAFTFR